MRLSLWLPARQRWADLVAMASRAAATGWDGVWLADEAQALECWTALAGLATLVPAITLGGLTRDDRHRHPAVLTKIASTVDQLSSGRVVVALAPGSGAEGPARLEESCRVVKCLAGADPAATMEGRFFRLHEAPLRPKPRQRPFPLVIWADGDERTIATAARHGTGWVTGAGRDTVGPQVAAVGQACQALDRNPDEVVVSVVSPLLPVDRATNVPVLDELVDAGVGEWIVDAHAGIGERERDALDQLIADVAGRA